jgi:hypothetical protein
MRTANRQLPVHCLRAIRTMARACCPAACAQLASGAPALKRGAAGGWHSPLPGPHPPPAAVAGTAPPSRSSRRRARAAGLPENGAAWPLDATATAWLHQGAGAQLLTRASMKSSPSSSWTKKSSNALASVSWPYSSSHVGSRMPSLRPARCTRRRRVTPPLATRCCCEWIGKRLRLGGCPAPHDPEALVGCARAARRAASPPPAAPAADTLRPRLSGWQLVPSLGPPAAGGLAGWAGGPSGGVQLLHTCGPWRGPAACACTP